MLISVGPIVNIVILNNASVSTTTSFATFKQNHDLSAGRQNNTPKN